MGLLINFFRQLRNWDRPSKLALLIGVVMLAVAVSVVAWGPGELRQPALVIAAGLLVVTQLIIIYGNRGMVTLYTQAQRHFLAGEFEQARDALLAHIQEKRDAGKKPAVDTYVLLGNTYRNLSQLDDSEAMLRQAQNMAPAHHFPLYGLGRTLMARGDYTEAATAIEHALQAGAPDIVWFDLGHIYYRLSKAEKALEALQRAPIATAEPHRQLMTSFLFHKLNAENAPTSAMIQTGLPFWIAEAERFAHTRYGRDLAADLVEMQNLQEGD